MILSLLLACVIDRTGQSATARLQAELADHGARVKTLETDAAALARRVGALEELTRARGQDEILKMETMEQVRLEVANLRGAVEVLEHQSKEATRSGDGFQQDTVTRLDGTEARISALEKSLGIKPPAAAGGAPAEAAPAWENADQAFALIEQALRDNKGGVARGVARAFLQKFPRHDRAPEAQYRLAESHQNERSFKDAAAAFLVVVDNWPASTWAPFAMLRQGECFEALGRKEDAKLFYEDVIARYPKSKAAKDARTRLGK